MVKIHMDGRHAHIEYDGDEKNTAFDVATAVSGIYQSMCAKENLDADMFKRLMQRSLEDGSPVWEANHNMTMISVPIKKSDTPADQS